MLYDNFFSRVWYTPISERDSLVPSRFLLQPINYRTYVSAYGRQALPDGVLREQFHDVILQESICEVENLAGQIGDNWAEILPPNIKNELLETILSLFFPSKEFYDTLNLSLDLSINPRFSGESWECETCQAKKLHFQRNCYLVPIEEHEESFSLQVLGEVIRTCPINKKDNILADAAFTAKNINEAGSLPEVGGLGDQTIFYAIASQKAHSTIEYYKNKQLEEQSAKAKRR